MNHKERNVLGNLTWGWSYFRPISEILPRQPLVYVKGVGEDKIYYHKLSTFV